MKKLRRGRYPQVEPGAAALMRRGVAPCPPRATVREALRLVRRRRLRLLTLSEGRTSGAIFPADLGRARALGLGTRRAAAVARWEIPMVTLSTPEAVVRRHLLEGAPAVLVRDGRRVVGAVESSVLPAGPPALSLLPRLERQLTRETLGLLRRIGGLGESLGVRTYAVGGFVRDILLGREARELDIVVEGDGLALARRLAEELGSTLTIHATFQTASLQSGALRLDVATARQERYRRPGALPQVTPASLGEDLPRRDFSVNAMALVLTPPGFGDLLDPLRGAPDVARRRLSVLHPLSFVEDPTRIFRAVRYQTRLGLTPDRGSRRALRLALDRIPYPALSGQRLLAEVELILSEPDPERSLIALGRLGAFRILDPSYTFPPLAARRVADLASLGRFMRERAIPLDPLALTLVALVGHLRPVVAGRCFERLALSGEPLARLTTAVREGPDLAKRLGRTRLMPPSARAALLRRQLPETLGAAWLAGTALARRQVEWFVGEGRTVEPLLGGDDLIALGVAPGPDMGELLDRLRDCRLDGLTVTRDEEIALVREWMGGARQKANCG